MNELWEATLELRRELTVRQSVYPRLVEQGKLSQKEADRRMAALTLALKHLMMTVSSVPEDP